MEGNNMNTDDNFALRSELLHDAEDAVNGDRNVQYGDPNQDFRRTAEFWSAYLGVPITAQQVGMMQILLKVSRSVWSPYKRDHYLDIAGYAACAYGTVASENNFTRGSNDADN